jgi:transcriptional regulator with XRE-family HTH domain
MQTSSLMAPGASRPRPKLKPRVRREIRYSVLLGVVLRELRRRRKHTQGALAATLGSNQATWSRYERGDSEIPASLAARAAVQLGETPLTLAAEVDRHTRALARKGIQVVLGRVADARPRQGIGPDELKVLFALRLIE